MRLIFCCSFAVYFIFLLFQKTFMGIKGFKNKEKINAAGLKNLKDFFFTVNCDLIVSVCFLLLLYFLGRVSRTVQTTHTLSVK